MQRRRLQSGDRVVIRQSWNFDIVPGDEGVIEKPMLDGFWINITTTFHDAFGKAAVGTRCMFFRAKHVAPALDQTESIEIGSA